MAQSAKLVHTACLVPNTDLTDRKCIGRRSVFRSDGYVATLGEWRVIVEPGTRKSEKNKEPGESNHIEKVVRLARRQRHLRCLTLLHLSMWEA